MLDNKMIGKYVIVRCKDAGGARWRSRSAHRPGVRVDRITSAARRAATSIARTARYSRDETKTAIFECLDELLPPLSSVDAAVVDRARKRADTLADQ